MTVTCPKKGKLWANATGRMSFDVTSDQFAGTVAYALSRNSTAMQANFQQNLFGRFVGNSATFPIAIQRVDSCNGGANACPLAEQLVGAGCDDRQWEMISRV